jgi:hypothetical protein
MAIVKVYKYEYFDPRQGKYVLSAGYATRPRIIAHNQTALRTTAKAWRLTVADCLEVEEALLSDGFYQRTRS